MSADKPQLLETLRVACFSVGEYASTHLLGDFQEINYLNKRTTETQRTQRNEEKRVFWALLNQNMNHAIASSLRALRTRSATEPYLR
ncbi:MAG: hypothetical protein V7K26_12345 [Nostoc sp.]|uniref:hypothetical protein n=1 Tax=Nostoc sp. TaxID=1180 RepID=UPI002FFB8159